MPPLVKNFRIYLFKKTPHNLTYAPLTPVFMRFPDSDLFSGEVTIKVTIEVTV